jgi:hypothetical protein
MRRICKGPLFALMVLFVAGLVTTASVAQVVITSTIVGTVTDPQKAMIPGAAVILTNQNTGVVWKATTDDAGSYQFANLIAGQYQIQVKGQGFADAITTSIALENGTTRRVNVTLKVGKVAETVDVSSAAALVKTDDANVSEVIQNQFVRELPIEGRSFLNYAQIVPGFNSGTSDNSRIAWGLASATSTGAKQLNVGGTEYGVGYYIDGLNNNDNWVEGPVTNVNMDAVQEVKAEVVNYSAEYGRDVGQISLTTKSGTNQLHGTVYDFFQNAGLNANDPYSIATDTPRSAYHQNQYGFTVGGPVYIPKLVDLRNKLFFFASFEKLRNRGEQQIHAYVPTTQELTGDFSDWLTRFPVDPGQCDGSDDSPSNCRYVIYDPSTLAYNSQGVGIRQPYLNNVITNADPKALAYLSHFPAPNYASPIEGDFNNWSGKTVGGIDNNNYTARADYNLTGRDSLYFRFSHDYGTLLSEGGLVPELALGDGPVHTTDTYQAHWVHTFGSTFNNELNFSITQAKNASNQAEQINRFMQTTWLPDLFQNTSTGGAGFTPYDLQQLGIKNDATFSVNFCPNDSSIFCSLGLGTTEYWYQAVPIYQLSDNAAKTINRHTLKFGFYWQRRDERDNDVIRSMSVGQYQYTGRDTSHNDGSGWNTLAEFETGDVSSMNQRTPLSGGDGSLWFRMPEYSAYVNDSWNFNPRLTLTLGLRYDVGVPAYSVDNYWGVLDQTYPGDRLVMPGLTPGTHNPPFPADKNNLAPRFGLAYRVNDKTVVRGGYGMFYETGRFKFLDQMFWSSPGYGGVTYDSATAASDSNAAFYTLNDVFPAAVSIPKGTWPIPLGEQGGELYPRQDIQTIDKDSAVTPYVQRWSLDIQREIGKSVVTSIGYVGSEGTKLTTQYDLNLPAQGVYPDGGTDGESFYEARPLTAIAPERWGAINAVHHNRSNNYHALNLQLKTQGWHGLTSMINYTWSKQMDTIFGESGENGVQSIGGQWHPEWSYGPSDANHTNRFVAALLYELPGKTLSNHILREALGGWQLNAIATFESGSPVTVWNGSSSSFDGMGDVPDQTCNGNVSKGNRTFTHYFNTDCYVEPDFDPDTLIATHRGDERRNNLRAPGINNWDLSLGKSFPVFGEGRQLQVRAESFNAFNHTQWSTINTYDDRQSNDESQFGYITGARPGRHMQIALKFVF